MAKKIDVDLVLAEELASKGYPLPIVCKALGITKTTAYNHVDIKEAIFRGHNIARQKIVDDLMIRSAADTSSASAIYLANKMKVFDDTFTTATPKTVLEAVERVASIYTAVAAGELDGDKGDKLVGYLDKFIRGKEVSELENRLTALEEANNGK